MNDLEKEVRKSSFGKGARKLIGTVILAGAGFGAGFLYGGMKESQTHYLEQKQFQKEKVELIIEGYTPAPGTDHQGYLVRPQTSIDEQAKTFQYDMKKDTVDFGPVRLDGRIGFTLPERTERAIGSEWGKLQEYGHKIGQKFDEQWQKVKNYFHQDTLQENARAP